LEIQDLLHKNSLKILIQRCDKIGDMVFTFPLLDQLRATFQDVQIDFVASDQGELALKEYGAIQTIYVLNITNLVTNIKPLIKTLRSIKYDVFISLWNHPQLNKIGALANIPIRIGFQQSWLNKHIFTHHIRQPWPDLTKHVVEHNLSVMSAFNKLPEFKRANLATDKYQDNVFLKQLKQSNKKIILIFTETGGSNIPFPDKVIKEFITKVCDKKYHIVLAGSYNSERFDERELKNTSNLIGKTSFTDLIACISGCDYYIGPDTGPTQFASALNKPMIFFSPLKANHPSLYGPLSNRQIIIRKEYCFPKLHIVPSDHKRLLSYLSGDSLLEIFNKLTNESSHFESYDEMSFYHLLHTFRILYFPYKNESSEELNKRCEYLQNEGLKIYLISKVSLRAIINQMILRNANVFQGNVPTWIKIAVHIYMGSIAHFLQPVYVSGSIVNTATKTLVKKYKQAFQKRV
jgi:heptosyltransferase-2